MSKWIIDSAHSVAGFKVQHLGISWVRGEIYGVTGSVDFDAANPAATSFEGTIDVNTLTTGQPQRDGHLKSPDFFDVANFATINFVSTQVTSVSGNTAQVTGNLTIRGVSKEVTLGVTMNGTSEKVNQDGSSQNVVAFSLSTQIDRTDFGLNWNMNIPGEKLLVGNQVVIEVEIEAIQE